ncbi:MAG: nucleotide sugar dehydrogenase, partial [Anaerolineae bacterium]
NIQRDLNIALMNELAMLFARLGIDIGEVLRAARTKWNFLPFEPGLVGGHCIPVDPYYLTHKAQEIGYHPEVILAGRRINDQMGVYVAQETVRLLIKAGKAVQGARILVLGVTFKENVRDIRNSRVMDLIRHLESYGAEVEVHDPLVEDDQLRRVGLRLAPAPFRTQPNKPDEPSPRGERDQPTYDALVLAVPHRTFRERGIGEYLALLRHEATPGVLVDVKGILPCDIGEDQHVLRWSL